MNIEYKDVLIDSANIEQCRQSLTAATLCSRWRTFDAQGRGACKIIVYNYVLDARLGIGLGDPLRLRINQLNANRSHIIAHEKHHLHNESIGHAFYVVDGNLFPFMCLQCADEVSARVAETLSKLSGQVEDLMQSRTVYNNAILDALEQFDKLFPKYCDDFISNYQSALRVFKTDAGRRAILRPQLKLLESDLSMARAGLQNPRFDMAIGHYFTIDGVDVRKKLYKYVRNTARDFGDYFISCMLNRAKNTINELFDQTVSPVKHR